MEAPISGTQRKVMAASVRPVNRSDGDEGIVVRNGRTAPFRVTRSWVAPAGHYPEAWYLINPETREVFYEYQQADAAILGLQALTELTTVVGDGIALPEGRYQMVFALGGVKGGELDVDVREPAGAAAA